jgi:hypothetical protein
VANDLKFAVDNGTCSSDAGLPRCAAEGGPDRWSSMTALRRSRTFPAKRDQGVRLLWSHLWMAAIKAASFSYRYDSAPVSISCIWADSCAGIGHGTMAT